MIFFPLEDCKKIQYIIEDPIFPTEVGIDLEKEEVLRVNEFLKRFNPIDGFYHA